VGVRALKQKVFYYAKYKRHTKFNTTLSIRPWLIQNFINLKEKMIKSFGKKYFK
jgi:hypothetical protein